MRFSKINQKFYNRKFYFRYMENLSKKNAVKACTLYILFTLQCILYGIIYILYFKLSSKTFQIKSCIKNENRRENDKNTAKYCVYMYSVFRIHIILIWIRIRGSVSVIMDPDPRYLPLSNPKVKNVVINLLCKH